MFRRGERIIADQELIELVKLGDDDAFRQLVEKYRQDVFRTIYSILKDQKEAEDAAQEVFLKIYYSLPKYENQGFKTWITRIAVNHSIDVKRKQQRRKEDITEQIELDTGKKDNVVAEVLIRQQRKLLREKLNDIPDNYRDVIYGYYIAEKSYQQLAEEQNVQVKTIETKLYRARIWLKKHWKEEDFL
ncbi:MULTISPECIES: RNA polymerase sigma factor [Bacillaceae]|uniref:RNA polymerase sigma factor n=1 Tax=Bacillaceae TaxID=186817 RepID=UPI001E284ACA|nr:MULTISPECIES: sigma-70 family RNA polymerase sigma factor [unclassified Niallia]MCE4049956.1 sigma-70 family RNA polymerase sigma factor [Bacillus sp. Au-Bac7]MCM3032746.1 sigma-70 family RNA polymerase sigma factor [Niallia sp. MER 6]MDL0436906.1 sigma-70 family RNA polymerase sigma factor [Niallia sp. SS-2023]UPO88022.1 sigma-70 family RNA polymerase sigma factor [Niallia sp. Man26]